MKKFPLLLLAIAFAYLPKAQNTQPGCYPFPKTISVNGSAEMEIIPDEIYVLVELKEYKKKGEDKTEIDKIKTDFLSNCKAIGIADSNISVASFDGYNMASIWKRRKKDPDLFASISYQLKFSNTKLLDELVNRLDDQATSNFRVIRTSHSKITEYRKQLKIMAVKAAMEKAIYLTEAINEHLGQVVTITEPIPSWGEENSNPTSNSVNNIRDNNTSGFYSVDENGIDFMKFKLRFEVKVLYAIK